jgi:hypothetical protein
MEPIPLLHRAKAFIRTATICLGELAAIFFTSFFIADYFPITGLLVALFFMFVIAINFHVRISRVLLKNKSNRVLYTIFVIILSFSLLAFKVWVNEAETWYCISDKLSYPSRLLNYLSFFFWTGIFLWELCYSLISSSFRYRFY